MSSRPRRAPRRPGHNVSESAPRRGPTTPTTASPRDPGLVATWEDTIIRTLVFFSGHQGSSWLLDMLGSAPGVYVPGSSPGGPERHGGAEATFLDLTFSLPISEDAYAIWVAGLDLGR